MRGLNSAQLAMMRRIDDYKPSGRDATKSETRILDQLESRKLIVGVRVWGGRVPRLTEIGRLVLQAILADRKRGAMP